MLGLTYIFIDERPPSWVTASPEEVVTVSGGPLYYRKLTLVFVKHDVCNPKYLLSLATPSDPVVVVPCTYFINGGNGVPLEVTAGFMEAAAFVEKIKAVSEVRILAALCMKIVSIGYGCQSKLELGPILNVWFVCQCVVLIQPLLPMTLCHGEASAIHFFFWYGLITFLCW